MHDPQRFALEHEAAKAKQAAILQRRRNGLEQRVGSQRVDQPAVQYQLPEPVAPRQRRPVDSDFAMNTSHDARAEYSESAYPSFPLSRCSLPTEARAPRYALDAFGRAYEVDEYGNSVARELVQLELAPLRDSRPSTSGGAPRLPSPFQFGHPTLSRSLYSGHISAPIANQYSFVDEEAHVSQQYDPRYPLLSQDAERRWNQSGRSVSLGRAHSSDDRRINPPSSSIEWQSSTWPLAPASSAYYQAYRTPHLAPSDSPARAPPPAGIRDFDGPQAGMSATLSHAHGPDDNTPVLSSRVPSLRAGAPSPEGTRWLRSGPVGALSQNPSADASAPLPPRDPNLHPSQYSTGAHDLPRPLLTHSDPPSSFASSPKTTATRTSVSSPDPNPVFSAARERQTMAYSPVDSPPGQLRDADTLLEGNAPGHESSPPSA
ncbi:hypothetical protein C6P46_000737 [Rhodotorula mucilaginosa]|jgi:hypothetical protein|uniref:Uncharacterized protein n=1 Tax=Rhodotorula mucilaginosa TaxID=5537 RepID=A0A9P6VVY5_RHOMI|nr:hypothetical protein C6P46_000737 [Rhodotorula mucilaginosa]TKA50452.1 hypothetical protein B0A53_06122 [Rhodotorula sp. CCFEE 5036]